MKKRALHILLYLLVLTVPAAVAAQGEDTGDSPDVPTVTSIDIMDNAVEISVSGDFVYTAYKPSDPFTVAVDLPEVGMGEFEGKIPSDKKGISQVTVTGTRTPMASTRVEILLDSPAGVEPIKTDNSLLVKIKEDEARAAGEAPGMEEVEVAQEAAPAEGEAEEEEEPLPPATKITEVGFDYSNGTLDLVVKGNGALDPQVYALDGRIVIDVPGVEMEASMPAAVVTPVKAVRYGMRNGKVRLVVDLKEAVRFKASTEGEKLMISLPAEEVLEVMKAEDVSEEEAPAEEAMPEEEAPAEPVAGKYTGKIISLDFQNANIVPIFRFIGDISGYNVVVHPTVSGTVTLKLDNVPWDQALDIVLNLYGLEKKVEGNIMTIAPASVFDRLAKERKQRRTTEEVVAELVQKEIKLKYIEASKMKSLLEEAKVVSARGNIMIDERRNMLIVRDTPLQHKEIRDFVGTWDIAEQRQMQVMIEAKIVEANADSDLDLGIRWGGNFAADLGGPDGPLTGDFSVNTPPIPAGPASTVGGGAVNLLIGTVDTFQVNLSIEALETAGELRKLSNPRILTLEGQSASIQQGAQIPVQTTTAEGSTTEFKNANLSLNVTPTVKPGGTLQLQIQANNDTPQVTPGGETGINTQSITTTALVGDGETLVIGGIYTNSEDVRDTGIPGLRKIPILGWLFGVKSVSVETTELLILITPRILAPSQ